MEKISIKTKRRCEIIDITDKVEAVISKSKIRQGCCVIFVPHTTAGLTINENADPSVRQDIDNSLSILVPHRGNYSHAEGNSDAHIKSSLLGSSLTVLFEANRLCLGTWQGIFFVEGDGPRQREIWFRLIG